MNISSIYGIGKTSLDLLEAAGFHHVESLAGADVDALCDELTRANSILRISKRNPTRSAVEKWIHMARDLSDAVEYVEETDEEGDEESYEEAPGDPPEPAEPAEAEIAAVNYEASQKVISMLSSAPFALPLPARLLVENQLAVAEIPAGILLNRYTGDLDVKVEARLPKLRQPKASSGSSGYVRLAENGVQRLEIDVSRIRSTEDLGETMLRGPVIKTSPANDRVALLRAPRSSTNEGRDPGSRWYIRGVLHSHPVSVYVGAFATVLVMFMVPVAVISAALLFLSTEKPEHFSWVPEWLLVVPVALPLFGIAYLIWGISGSCRICGQKLFVHRSHLKNVKAHRVRGLGYILPLCFQILIFRWFRCTHCGTPVRLKE